MPGVCHIDQHVLIGYSAKIGRLGDWLAPKSRGLGESSNCLDNLGRYSA